MAVGPQVKTLSCRAIDKEVQLPDYEVIPYSDPKIDPQKMQR